MRSTGSEDQRGEPPRALRGIWLGRRRYAPVFDLQNQLREAVGAGEVSNTVLLLEHEPVITFGRGAREHHLLASERALAENGIDLVRTDRGGDVTVHGPGQLVAYPIVGLAPDRCDVRRYVADLAETMRRTAARFGVASGPVPGLVGLWADPEAPGRWDPATPPATMAKLGAIGVRISRWVTMHGFALNLSTDLALFQLIVPCGISQHGVTSIEALTGRAPAVEETARLALEDFAGVLSADIVALDDWSRVASLEDAVERLR